MIERRLAILAAIMVMVVLPAASGIVIIESSRYSRYFDNVPRYLLHAPPAEEPGRLLADLGYQTHDVARQGVPVPRVFVTALPKSLSELSTKQRKQVFTHALLPLVLRVNEIILADRARLMSLRQQISSGIPLTELERKWLSKTATYYRIKKLPQDETDLNFGELLRRADGIPSSLALAQAAIESSWGRSRFAQDGNALFGQWVIGDVKGLLPEGRDEGATHKIANFDYLIQSVMSYARNLNTHAAYRQFRTERAALRGGTPAPGSRGLLLAANLKAYSQDGEGYERTIKSVISGNGFYELETASLEPKWWASP